VLYATAIPENKRERDKAITPGSAGMTRSATISVLGLGRFPAHERTVDLPGVFCHGPLADLPRKSCESIALYPGVAVHNLREFLKPPCRSFARDRDLLQRHVVRQLPGLAGNDLGTVGRVGETPTKKRGWRCLLPQRRGYGLNSCSGCLPASARHRDD
jgi:hypothetical protein